MSRHSNFAWSRAVWHSFHTLAANCKDDPGSIEQIKSIIALFALLLPCVVCRQHAVSYIKPKQGDIKNKDKLIIFLYNFHNSVKKEKKLAISPIEILKQYKNKDKTHINKIVNTAVNACRPTLYNGPDQLRYYQRRSQQLLEKMKIINF